MSPRDEIPSLKGLDGEGSVQVHQDPDPEDRGGQGVFGLWQGRDRQVDDQFEPVGGFSMMGKRVLQIGCDPKHDSTFTLTGGCSPR
jgi:light-independent protochlorophyllide reductase subunit L